MTLNPLRITLLSLHQTCCHELKINPNEVYCKMKEIYTLG